MSQCISDTLPKSDLPNVTSRESVLRLLELGGTYLDASAGSP